MYPSRPDGRPVHPFRSCPRGSDLRAERSSLDLLSRRSDVFGESWTMPIVGTERRNRHSPSAGGSRSIARGRFNAHEKAFRDGIVGDLRVTGRRPELRSAICQASDANSHDRHFTSSHTKTSLRLWRLADIPLYFQDLQSTRRWLRRRASTCSRSLSSYHVARSFRIVSPRSVSCWQP